MSYAVVLFVFIKFLFLLGPGPDIKSEPGLLPTLSVELFASDVYVVGAGLVLNVNDYWHCIVPFFFIFSLRHVVLHYGLAD
jgi:hypothetical protein